MCQAPKIKIQLIQTDLENVRFPLAVAAGKHCVNRWWDPPHLCDVTGRSRNHVSVQKPEEVPWKTQHYHVRGARLHTSSIHVGTNLWKPQLCRSSVLWLRWPAARCTDLCHCCHLEKREIFVRRLFVAWDLFPISKDCSLKQLLAKMKATTGNISASTAGLDLIRVAENLFQRTEYFLPAWKSPGVSTLTLCGVTTGLISGLVGGWVRAGLAGGGWSGFAWGFSVALVESGLTFEGPAVVTPGVMSSIASPCAASVDRGTRVVSWFWSWGSFVTSFASVAVFDVVFSGMAVCSSVDDPGILVAWEFSSTVEELGEAGVEEEPGGVTSSISEGPALGSFTSPKSPGCISACAVWSCGTLTVWSSGVGEGRVEMWSTPVVDWGRDVPTSDELVGPPGAEIRTLFF